MTRSSRWLAGVVALSIAGLAVADSLLVVRKAERAVEFVEPGTGARLMSVQVGSGPHEIAVSPDGRRALVTNYGTPDDPGHTVSLLDLEQPHELVRIDLGAHNRPHGVAWYAPDRAAVTSEGSRHLLLLDPLAHRVVAEIPTGQSGSHMVVVTRDGQRAFVSNIESGTTTAVDLGSGRKLRDLDTGAGSEGIALSPDGAELWVAAGDAGRITVIDTQTLETRAGFALAGEPIRIVFAADGRIVLVSCAGSGEVVAIDARSRTVTARRHLEIPIPTSTLERPADTIAADNPVPLGLAIAADGRSAYVSATRADAVVKLELPGLAVSQTFALPGEPAGLGLTTLLPRYKCHACEPGAE
jgi:DNA-binding beta-propeller fold protein YncE